MYTTIYTAGCPTAYCREATAVTAEQTAGCTIGRFCSTNYQKCTMVAADSHRTAPMSVGFHCPTNYHRCTNIAEDLHTIGFRCPTNYEKCTKVTPHAETYTMMGCYTHNYACPTKTIYHSPNNAAGVGQTAYQGCPKPTTHTQLLGCTTATGSPQDNIDKNTQPLPPSIWHCHFTQYLCGERITSWEGCPTQVGCPTGIGCSAICPTVASPCTDPVRTVQNDVVGQVAYQGHPHPTTTVQNTTIQNDRVIGGETSWYTCQRTIATVCTQVGCPTGLGCSAICPTVASPCTGPVTTVQNDAVVGGPTSWRTCPTHEVGCSAICPTVASPCTGPVTTVQNDAVVGGLTSWRTCPTHEVGCSAICPTVASPCTGPITTVQNTTIQNDVKVGPTGWHTCQRTIATVCTQFGCPTQVGCLTQGVGCSAICPTVASPCTGPITTVQNTTIQNDTVVGGRTSWHTCQRTLPTVCTQFGCPTQVHCPTGIGCSVMCPTVASPCTSPAPAVQNAAALNNTDTAEGCTVHTCWGTRCGTCEEVTPDAGPTHHLLGCTTVTVTPTHHLLGCGTATIPPVKTVDAKDLGKTGTNPCPYPTNVLGCTGITHTPEDRKKIGGRTVWYTCVPETHLLGCTTETGTPVIGHTGPFTCIPATHLYGCTGITATPKLIGETGWHTCVGETQLYGCTGITTPPVEDTSTGADSIGGDTTFETCTPPDPAA